MGQQSLEWIKMFNRETADYHAQFPYSVEVNYLGCGLMSDHRTEWCKTTFGQMYKRWAVYRVSDYDRTMRFYFRNDRDLTLFRLKWA
jgi:hypothetical protein